MNMNFSVHILQLPGRLSSSLLLSSVPHLNLLASISATFKLNLIELSPFS
jgi:hypothetical protein